MGKKISEKMTIHMAQICAREKMHQHLLFLLKQQDGLAIRPLILLCIGSDRYTGDALGPLVGSYLQEHTNSIIYGSLDYPVHAGNLVETINIIQHQHYHPIIIAIDACLGKNHEIGNIEIWQGALQAGIAVGNHLPSVGDISIIGVVNAGGQLGYMELQCTPLSIVVKLSKLIGATIEEVIHKLNVQIEAMMVLG